MPRRGIQKKADNGGKAPLKSILGRDFNLVAIINLFVMTIYYMVFVTSAQYALDRFPASLSAAGLSAGVMVIGCLAGRLLGGHFYAQFGGKRMLFGGLLIFIASFLLCFFASSLSLLYLIRFITGFGVGVIGTATATIAARSLPGQARGFGISVFSLGTVLALALGPFIGIMLGSAIGEAARLWGMSAIGFCLLPLALCLRQSPEVHKKRRKLLDPWSYIDPRVIRFAIVIGIIFMSYGSIQAFIQPYAAGRGLSEAASLFFLVYGIAAFASRPYTGRKLDARGENAIIYPLFGFTLAGLLGLAIAESGAGLLLCAAACGIGLGNFQSIGQAISLALVTPTRYAHATTTFFIFMDLGIGAGPYAFGLVSEAYGYGAMFLALAGAVVCALCMYYFLYGRQCLAARA